MRLSALAFLAGLAAACGSSGEASTATSGSTGGGTSGGGGAAACLTAQDCPPASGCAIAVCESGSCLVKLATAGTPLENDLSFGDCQRQVCGADGSIDSVTDDTDLPNDWNPCTADSCVSGSPVHGSVPDGTPCGREGPGPDTSCLGGLCANCDKDEDCPAGDVCHLPVCDDQTEVCLLAIDVGKVVSDVDPEDCTHAVCDQGGAIVVASVANGTLCAGSTFCHPSRCDAGACEVDADPPDGTPDPDQLPGDCLEVQCDGGATKKVADDADAPSDPTPSDCTLPACAMGAVTTANRPAGTGCAGGIDGICDGAGNCT